MTSDEIATKELELDKVIIQLIQNAYKNDKFPRALDLVKMLHHTASYDMAAKVAGFYHLIGLQEKIETLKANCGGVTKMSMGSSRGRLRGGNGSNGGGKRQELFHLLAQLGSR